MKLILPIIIFSFSFSLTGQALYRVTGQITGSDGTALSYANVILLKSLDSSFVKGAVTEDSGDFIFTDVPKGTYRVLTSMVGYASKYSNLMSLTADVALEPIILSQQEALAEVVIVERKPLYTHKVDRLVINIENSIVSVAGTALEILERSPGVVINRQNNTISLVGKEGVVLLINGKNSNTPANAMVQILQGLAANNIESIELLTTPPSNYDAEGNAGFVNVVLKKRLDIGLNGSYAFSIGYGKGFINSDNINFNYRKDKINLFGSYAFLTDNKIQNFIASRKVFKGADVLSNYTNTARDAVQRNHNIRIGLDYELNDKTILGVLINTYDNRWSMQAQNQNTAAKNGLPTGFIELMNDEINRWQHAGANFNVKHNITKEAFWTLNLDYLYYKDDNPNNYINSIFDAQYTFIRNDLANSSKLTPINTVVANWDYSNKLSDKINFEMGVKGTVSAFNNDVAVNNLKNGTWENDFDLTNSSTLNEKIYAMYSAVDISLDDATTLKAGLRFEQTDSELSTDKEGKVVDRNYGKIFPTIFLNRKISKNVNMNWSYSKRITRPTFNDLAPFVILIDPTTFVAGNAALQPAISNNFKYDITYSSYFLSLQYAHQLSPIASFQERIDKATGRLIFEASNLDYTRTYSATVGLPVEITPFWKTQNNFSFVYQTVHATREEKPLKISLGNYSLNSIHAFKLSGTWSAELSGFYNSAGFFGIARYEGFYGINAGVQKMLGEKWGSLRLSVNDIFDSIVFKGSTNVEGEGFVTNDTFDFTNRTFSLTYTRNFGRSQVKSARNRKTGSEEERERVNQ